MKTSNQIIRTFCFPAVVAISLAFTSCSNNKDNAENRADQNYTEPSAEEKRDIQREKDEFRAEMNEKIEANKNEIAELKAELKNKKRETQKDYQEKIDQLEAKNDRMRDKLSDVKNDTDNDWDQFKTEFRRDMNELGTSIADVFRDNH